MLGGRQKLRRIEHQHDALGTVEIDYASHEARENPMAVGGRLGREDLAALEAFLRSL